MKTSSAFLLIIGVLLIGIVHFFMFPGFYESVLLFSYSITTAVLLVARIRSSNYITALESSYFKLDKLGHKLYNENKKLRHQAALWASKYKNLKRYGNSSK